jgi:hypothetical protein
MYAEQASFTAKMGRGVLVVWVKYGQRIFLSGLELPLIGF